MRGLRVVVCVFLKEYEPATYTNLAYHIIPCAFFILFTLAVETSVESKFQTAANQGPVTQIPGRNLNGDRTYLLEKVYLL